MTPKFFSVYDSLSLSLAFVKQSKNLLNSLAKQVKYKKNLRKTE